MGPPGLPGDDRALFGRLGGPTDADRVDGLPGDVIMKRPPANNTVLVVYDNNWYPLASQKEHGTTRSDRDWYSHKNLVAN